MNRRMLMLALPALVATTTAGAYAFGGWAVVTVDEVPTQLTVGKPTTFTFIIRQHGVSLMNDLKPTIEARSGSILTGSTINAGATRTSAPGQYAATLTVPKAGEWRITINSGWGNSHIKLQPLQAVEAGKAVAVVADAERGKHLFAAKGCTTCHVSKDVEGGLQMDVGPELTGKTYDPAYLAMWLANPRIKPPTKAGNEMPNLGLSKAEITALVAYVNGGRVAASK